MTTETRGQPQLQTDRMYRFTTAQYYAMAEAGALPPHERTELIDGVIYKMTPVGRRHTWSNRRFANLVMKATDLDGFWLLVGDEVKLNDFTVVQPDLSVIHPRDHQYLSEPPKPEDTVLLIEISDSTLVFDRTIKASLYAEAGVPEYWVVDIQNRRIVVFTEPSATGYIGSKEYKAGDIVRTAALPSLSINVSDVIPPGVSGAEN